MAVLAAYIPADSEVDIVRGRIIDVRPQEREGGSELIMFVLALVFIVAVVTGLVILAAVLAYAPDCPRSD